MKRLDTTLAGYGLDLIDHDATAKTTRIQTP